MKFGIAIGLCLLASPASAQPCKPASFPQTPATIAWTVTAPAKRVMALNATSGVKLWETSIAHGDTTGRRDPMVVTNGRVVVNLGRELRMIALADGHVLKNAVMPTSIRLLEGPPLIAVANNAPRLGSTVFALDNDGRIRAKRIVRNVEELWFAGDTVIARMTRNLYNEAPEMNVVAAFRATDLAELWQFRARGADLQQIDGHWYIGDTSWSQMRPLDLATGHLGKPLPPKPPTDIVWGGATWQIEIAASSEDKTAPCERLRVNDPATGKGWTLDLPFDVTNTLRTGDKLYVFGSRDDTHHFLAEIDWQTGHLKRLWNGIPMSLDHFYLHHDLIVGVGIMDGATAMRIH